MRGDELDELTDFDASAADAIGRQFAEESDSFQQELRLASGSDSRVTWLAGLYYFTEEVDRLGQFFLGAHNTFVIGLGPFPGNGGVPFSNLDTRTIETDSWAAFGQLTIPLGERFNVTLGGRYTEDEKSMRRNAQTVGATDLVNPFLEQAFEVEVAADWNSFDPAFILDYHFNDDHMAYASYRQGYKSGGFQADPVINAAAAAVVFNPEEVRSTEIGYKANAFDGRLQLNAAAHLSTYDNLQFLGTVALEQRRVRLADRQRRARGSEGSRARLRSPARARPDIARKLRLLSIRHSSGLCHRAGADLAGAQTNRSPENTYAVGSSLRPGPVGRQHPRIRGREHAFGRVRVRGNEPRAVQHERGLHALRRADLTSAVPADSPLASHVVGQESNGRSVQDAQTDDRRDPPRLWSSPQWTLMRGRARTVWKSRGSTATSRKQCGLVGAQHVVRAETHRPLLKAFAQPLDFGCAEGRDDLLLGGLHDVLDAGHELAPLGREVDQLGAPVGRIRAALEESGDARTR